MGLVKSAVRRVAGIVSKAIPAEGMTMDKALEEVAKKQIGRTYLYKFTVHFPDSSKPETYWFSSDKVGLPSIVIGNITYRVTSCCIAGGSVILHLGNIAK